MFRLNYSNLTKTQVEGILASSPPPICAAEFCDHLVGKSLKIILDKTPVEGPLLEYEFKSKTALVLRENGGATVECAYGALSLKDITLFSHMIPATKKGYNVIVNWKTTVITVYEMWFIDYEGEVIDTYKTFYEVGIAGKLKPFINREVQRQCYYGYFMNSNKEPPKMRDKISLRLENCMVEWQEDRGKHRLTTYTSTTYSTLVELDTPDGGDVLTFVSDVLQISDSIFIHCFGEVEYSGRLSVEVLDLLSLKKIGITMGIDESDAFEYTLYNGNGKYIGRFPTFHDFNDKGDRYSNFITSRVDFSVKGARAVYRPSIMTKRLTREELTEVSKNPMIFDSDRAKERVMASSNVLDDSSYCVGKEFVFRGDGDFVVDLRFKTISELEYRIEGDN